MLHGGWMVHGKSGTTLLPLLLLLLSRSALKFLSPTPTGGLRTDYSLLGRQRATLFFAPLQWYRAAALQELLEFHCHTILYLAAAGKPPASPVSLLRALGPAQMRRRCGVRTADLPSAAPA